MKCACLRNFLGASGGLSVATFRLLRWVYCVVWLQSVKGLGGFALQVRLRHCLGPKTRRWAMCEFLTSAIDRPWMLDAAMPQFMMFLGLSGVTSLTRKEWNFIRAQLGSPRRLSLKFLKEVC